MVDVDVRVSSHLKEELAWAVDKRLWIISAIMFFKSSKSTKELKGTEVILNLKQNCIHCYVALSITYFNYFKILSTVTFL